MHSYSRSFCLQFTEERQEGRRVVTREIDFIDDDNEVTSPSEDLLTSTSYTTATEPTLEHADDVEQLKKLRQLGGEGWLPAIDHVVQVQPEEQEVPVVIKCIS
ncbi:hypothetical protein OS493_016084 [Desmophyllum pertusum]|uniref:Uncharacterized protein n=1 Tax=Desmophyllum pertusum TaxID=174260 RepID=A0A9X0D9T0_9CNID|nr:hypothetical protein OS493_016084 [Desmophyllum pertusum]